MTRTNKFFAAQLAQERLKFSTIPAAVGDDFMINRSMELLFDLSTCRSICARGDHVIESLTGRIVNHGISAIMLDASGFHDEALSLVRSIGEITNLFALFCNDSTSKRNWTESSEYERKQNFSPIKVRIAIERKNKIAIPMDERQYKELCEKYVHVTPSTAPNAHNILAMRHVGGYYQEQGTSCFVKALKYLLMQCVMLSSSFLGRNEIVHEYQQYFEE